MQGSVLENAMEVSAEYPASYEVLTYTDNRWMVSLITGDREEALHEARLLETSKHHRAIAVVQDTSDPDSGRISSMVIFKGGQEAKTLDPFGQKKTRRKYEGPKKEATPPTEPATSKDAILRQTENSSELLLKSKNAI